jgi:hypothetical protein
VPTHLGMGLATEVEFAKKALKPNARLLRQCITLTVASGFDQDCGGASPESCE